MKLDFLIFSQTIKVYLLSIRYRYRMINFSFGPNIFLGILLIIAVLVLYFLRNIRPELARDEDIFLVTIGSLYSCILMIHGWRLDPILLFSQFLIIIITLLAGWENIRLRGLITLMIKLNKKI